MKKILALSALALTLSACSSTSNSSNNNTQPIPSATNSITNPPAKTIPAVPTTGKMQGFQVANVIVRSGSDSLNSITINGNPLQIIPQSFSVGKDLSMIGTNLNGITMDRQVPNISAHKHSRYGFASDNGGQGAFFAHGELSKEVPKDGFVTYKAAQYTVPMAQRNLSKARPNSMHSLSPKPSEASLILTLKYPRLALWQI